MRKEMNLDSMEELEKAAQSQGVSFEDFKQNMRNQIITQQVIGKEVGSRLVISKEDEKKFYEEHKNEMEQPETIRLSEILVSTETRNRMIPRDEAQTAFRRHRRRLTSLLPRFKKGPNLMISRRKTPTGPPPPRAEIWVI